MAEKLKPYIEEESARTRVARDTLQIAIESYSGHLPHPRHFDQYEKAVPGSGLRLIVIAETEQRHRHRLEQLQLQYAYVGLAADVLTTLLCVGGVIYLGAVGRTLMATELVGVPLLGVIGWFVRSRIDLPSRRGSAHQASLLARE